MLCWQILVPELRYSPERQHYSPNESDFACFSEVKSSMNQQRKAFWQVDGLSVI